MRVCRFLRLLQALLVSLDHLLERVTRANSIDQNRCGRSIFFRAVR